MSEKSEKETTYSNKINDCIDKVSKKYGYNSELINALKRCVQSMIQEKTEEDISLLMETLERVQIYTFDNQPEQEEIDSIIEEKLNGRNDFVKTISCDKGEYEKQISPSAYISNPIFDDEMNIIDRVGVIYITNLYDGNSDTAKFYGTKINLSHLIHEIGHAWAAQKGEFEQEENGDFTMSIGTAKFHNRVDRKNKTVEETGIDGLYIEEALNSIEEENTLYRLFEINDYHDIPGYVPSKYQGVMTEMMRYYTEKLGKTAFEKARIQKDRIEIEELQEIFNETSFIKDAQGKEYYDNKEKDLNCVQSTNMSDKSKNRIKDFFEQYKELYLMPCKNQDFLVNLDRVMEQEFNFQSIKYSFNIFNEDEKKAYQQIQNAIIKEGYIPVNQAADIIEERKNQNRKQVTISRLAREALEDKIRKDEVTKVKNIGENTKSMEEKNIDEPSL